MTSLSPDTAIIDLRSRAAFEHDRPQGAVWFSLEDLRQRAYLLPPRSQPLIVIGANTEDCRQAAAILQQAERPVQTLVEPQWRAQLATESGPPSRRALWQPAAIVQQAINQHAASLPGKRAIDVACGTGRNAVYLAQQGFAVVGIDWLPDALTRVEDLAQRSGVHVTTQVQNLEEVDALHDLQADCVVVVRYLDRTLMPRLCEAITPGGILIYETFTIAQKAVGHPRNPLYLLQPDELRTHFPQLETLHYEEGLHDGAHTAQLIARRALR